MIKSSNSSIICWKFFFLSKSSSDAISLFKDEMTFFRTNFGTEQLRLGIRPVQSMPLHAAWLRHAYHLYNPVRCNHEYGVSPSCILRARVKEAGIQEIMLRATN